MNKLRCGKCGDQTFAIEAEHREKIEEIDNYISDYYWIRFTCTSCGNTREIVLGSD